MSAPEPYLSVVVTSRNDDHGESLLRKMQAFVNCFLEECKQHALPAELIVVEWNPPEDRPRLAEIVQWPQDLGPCRIRIIEVPHEIHQRYQHAENLPLYQMIAKNVGIRRAHGRFVLATNIDILLSEELMQFIARQELDPNRMYRIDRYDTMTDVPVGAPVKEQLAYCETHLLRINEREGTFPLNPDGTRVATAATSGPLGGGPREQQLFETGVAWGAGWYPAEQYFGEMFRWAASQAEFFVRCPQGPRQALTMELEPGPAVGREALRLRLLDSSGQLSGEISISRRSLVQVAPAFSGDRQRFHLQVVGGGLAVPGETRILDFRIFRYEWTEPWNAEAPLACRAVPLRRRLVSWAERLLILLQQFRPGKHNRIGLPVPRRLIESLGLRIDGTGLSIALNPGPLFAGLRKPWRGKPGAQDIVEPGTEVVFGPGWYPLESFKGETFRWAVDDAELTVYQPEGPPKPLALVLEHGPGVGFQPFPLHVLDQFGNPLAQLRVGRREQAFLSLPGKPGETQVLRFHVEGGNLPAKTRKGDPRILNFRLLRIGWVPNGTDENGASGPIGVLVPELEDVAGADSGILFGAGWQLNHTTDGELVRSARDGAELILRPAQREPKVLFLELEPAASPASASGGFVIEDAAGRTAATIPLRGRQVVHVALPLDPGRTQIFRFRAVRSSGSADAATGVLRLFKAIWSDEPAGVFEVSAGLAAGAGWSEPVYEKGRVYRRIETEAELPVRIPGGPERLLSIELESEPTAPIELEVENAEGRILERARVEGRKKIALALHWRPGHRYLLRLRWRWAGSPAAGGLKVLLCTWVSRRQQERDLSRSWNCKLEGVRAAATEDILPAQDAISLGRGWHPPECEGDEIFRWVTQDAELVFRRRLSNPLRLEVEAGPGPAQEAFILQVVDTFGEPVEEIAISGRSSVDIAPPVWATYPCVFRLRAKDGGAPSLDDPRILDFRVFRCSGVRVPAPAGEDIFRPGECLEPGLGWGPPEQDGQSILRLAATDAEIVVTRRPKRPVMIDLRSDSSLGKTPVSLQVINSLGEVVCETSLAARTTVEFPVPPWAVLPGVFRLHVQGLKHGTPKLHVFGCRLADEPEGAAEETGPAEPVVESTVVEPDPAILHTNACGDFTLLSREYWFGVRGYPEFDAYSFNIDSVLCYAAHYAGAREMVLEDPMRIYHIEHATGSGWTPEGQASLFARLAAKGIPYIDWPEVAGWASQMRRLGRPILFNGENWGLSELSLPEAVLPRPDKFHRPTTEDTEEMPKLSG